MSAPRHGSSGWDEFFTEESASTPAPAAQAAPGQGSASQAPATTRMPAGNAPTVRRATPAATRVSAPVADAAPSVQAAAPQAAPQSRRDAPATQATSTRQQTLHRKRQAGHVSEGRKTLRRVQPRVQATGALHAVPSQPYDDRAVPASQTAAHRALPTGGNPAVTRALLIAILALRLLAIALCGLVVALALPGMGARLSLVEASSVVSALMPRALSGLLVLPTPFGGAFRGDFALAALVLYVADWLLTRIRAGLVWGGALA